jgi:hypothetical protein
MDHVINYREAVLKEIIDIPEEFIPIIFEQIRAIKKTLKKKTGKTVSPTRRLLNLSGALKNPDGLSAKQYKRQVVDEYFANR